MRETRDLFGQQRTQTRQPKRRENQPEQAAGKTDHTIESEVMVEHIVELVEAKAASLKAEQQRAKIAAE